MDPPLANSTGTAGYFRFMREEVKEMEELLFPVTKNKLNRTIMDELAEKFSKSRERAGMVPVKTQQIVNWYHNNRHKPYAKMARGAQPAPVSTKDMGGNHQQAGSSSMSQPSATAMQEDESFSGNKYTAEDQTKYEAKSARDGAWYDVQNFRSKKLCEESGDLKLLVRFSGFGEEEDEWVNARTCLRQRSIPYRTTGCADIHIRDPVLCYKVTEQSALYFDAEVHGIQRKTHAPGEQCDCKILVVYVHDNSEDTVTLRRLCRRYVTNYKPQTKYELPEGKK